MPMALVVPKPPAEAPEVTAEAARVLDSYLTGVLGEANAVPELLHLHRREPRSMINAFEEKANSIVSNAEDHPTAAARAGTLLVSLASTIDGQAETERAAGGEASPVTGETQVSKCLLDHMMQLSGSTDRAPKEKAYRAQTCGMIAALVASVPNHRRAEAKLLEFAQDKLPAIREKAVRGAAALERSEDVQRALVARARDQHTAVRASAVRGLHADSRTVATLLQRLDDVEACVRSQVFHRLCEEPAAVETFGPAALSRLIAGVSDRSAMVRSAAGLAVGAWRKHLGGILELINRCDVLSDEALGECVAEGLVKLYPTDGVQVASDALGANRQASLAPASALLARCAVAGMDEDGRDEAVDVPTVLLQARKALQMTAEEQDTEGSDFILRQLLHILAILDVCDEAARKQVEELAEAVLREVPVLASASTAQENDRFAHSTFDLGILLLRKSIGLDVCRQAKKRQKLEADCSSRVVILVDDLCQALAQSDNSGEEGKDAEDTNLFLTHLSMQIEDMEGSIAGQEDQRESLRAQIKQAVNEEDYVKAHQIKESMSLVDAKLQPLKTEHKRLLLARDGTCMRVIAIVTALLRWSNSDLRKDPALFGSFENILRPIVMLKALSEEIQLAALEAVGLFSTLDGQHARMHWSFWTVLIRNLGKSDEDLSAGDRKHDRARAAVAAKTISDCARIHGGRGTFDREEVISAAASLALVPFWAREVTIGPLCGWLLSYGHIFFEEHMRFPLLEVQWALGWMLAEAFTQRAEGDDDEELCEVSGSDLSGEVVKQLAQFFHLLPKMPGRHGTPMLSLALESVVESGLWRRAVLLPKTVPGQTVWTRRWHAQGTGVLSLSQGHPRRGFKWPSLFAFVHEHLPVELRFRIWRCTMQLCVSSPELATFAEIPTSLANAAADAPPGAPELLHEAIALGADENALAPLLVQWPRPPAQEKSEAAGEPLLQPQDRAAAAEVERRSELAKLGVNVAAWAPGTEFQAPKMHCPHIKQRAAMPKRSARTQASLSPLKTQQKRAAKVQPTLKMPREEPEPATPSPTVNVAFLGGTGKKRRREETRRREESEVQQDGHTAPTKRLRSKTSSLDKKQARTRPGPPVSLPTLRDLE